MTDRTISWNAPYTFSGKEKDVETGYGYFGARYYDSGLSIWLSVDPMSDKYPSMSPYNYCANNPVKLIDPNGMEFVDNDGGPDGPMGKGDGPAPNQTNSNTLPPLSSVFPGLRPKEEKFSLKQDQSASQSGSTTTNNNNQSSSTNNSNTSSSTSNSNSQNQPKTTHEKANIDPNVSNFVMIFTELTKKPKGINPRSNGVSVGFDIVNTKDDVIDIINGDDNFDTYWGLGLRVVSYLGPVGKASAVVVDSYKRGGDWLINYLMEFEASLQQQYNPANW